MVFISIKDHQFTHFGDDINGMEMDYYFIVEYNNYSYKWNNLLCNRIIKFTKNINIIDEIIGKWNTYVFNNDNLHQNQK